MIVLQSKFVLSLFYLFLFLKKNLFYRFYEPILISRHRLELDPNYPLENIFKVVFRRGIFTIGLLFRYFDFKSQILQGTNSGMSFAF